MKSHARLFGHPIHQMLVVFPLGLLGGSVIFDLIYLATSNPTFATVAYWTLSVGIIAAVIVIPFGVIDWRAIPSETRAKRIGLFHALGNTIVSALFVISWYLRGGDAPSQAALACSFIAILLAGVTAWLGGELVSRLGVGVYDDANLNAPSSLRADDETVASASYSDRTTAQNRT